MHGLNFHNSKERVKIYLRKYNGIQKFVEEILKDLKRKIFFIITGLIYKNQMMRN